MSWFRKKLFPGSRFDIYSSSNLSEEVREMILTFMDPSEVANVIKNLQPDQIADILQDLPETVIAEVLDAMTDQNRQLVKKVLVYPENTAGGLMNTDLILVRPKLFFSIRSLKFSFPLE